MKTTKPNWRLNLIAAATAAIGALTLSSTLFALLHLHKARLAIADTHLTLIAGLSLIYLAMLLRRGKQNAWRVSIIVYVYLLLRNVRHIGFDDDFSRHSAWLIFSGLVLPAAVVASLFIWQRLFVVRSSPTTFRLALRRTTVILLVTFLYGLSGFMLFDKPDFHQEISVTDAAHYSIDQLGLTTNNQPTAYTKRAVFFVDSLASVSVASLAYVAISFFAPVRFRFYHRQYDHDRASELIKKYGRTSEDFFKLWPRDKVYFFNKARSAVIAYRVVNGVALAVGDPVGGLPDCKKILKDFLEFCQVNDWRPAFIHADDRMLKHYLQLELDAQKIGQEALVDINNFQANVAANKYFRNIKNRFLKQGYGFEILKPPHAVELVTQLRQISSDWLQGPGREERTFMLGYFELGYLNQCDLAVVKDADGRILAFLNQVPTVKATEANFDFLRSDRASPANINDFLMLNWLQYLQANNYQKVNMGLAPLAGVGNQSNKGLIDNVFKFVYQNGGRFYSFNGLARFKSKYEPAWEDRYIVYSGGLAGFGLTLTALLKAMTKRPRVNKR